MTDFPESVLQQLLSEIANKDARAFEQLYKHYHARVFAFVMHLHANRADAEEITDDVFLALALSPQAYHGASSMTTWLLGVAKHKVFDLLRERGRRIRTESHDDATWCELPETCDDVVTQALAHEQTLAIEHCREQLPVEQKEALFLAYYMDAGVAAIAAHMQCPVGTVKSRLSSAREKMQRCLARWTQGLHP